MGKEKNSCNKKKALLTVGAIAAATAVAAVAAKKAKENSDKLLKLGLTQKEVEKLWVKELLAIFFVPAILGVTITGYFLNSVYTAVFVQGYWFEYTLVVFAVYMVLQGIFFLLTCSHYKRVMRK